MFTPPPSPLPAPLIPLPTPPLSYQPSAKLSAPPKYPARERREHMSAFAIHDSKRQTGWRTCIMAIMVPLLLVLLALSTRYFNPSLFMDLVSRLFSSRPDWISDSVHPLRRRQNGLSTSTSDILFPSVTAGSTSTSPTPTQNPTSNVPTIPSTSPILPTPFPQPFDTTLANNFTTTTCQTFFTNMTQSPPFRQCRPFSFLSQTSSAFLLVSGSILIFLPAIKFLY